VVTAITVLLAGCGAGQPTGHVAEHAVFSGGPPPGQSGSLQQAATVELLSGSKVVARDHITPGAKFRFTAHAGSYQLVVAGLSICFGRAAIKANATTSAYVNGVGR
jgi:hypothetical protein